MRWDTKNCLQTDAKNQAVWENSIDINNEFHRINYIEFISLVFSSVQLWNKF